ncbi:hypothetical protein [Streptomyces parvulus]|uniref:hypothetical protein n=1 Tax=Streptomyces parvulus TaxID=146923 RepID=UPI003718310F
MIVYGIYRGDLARTLGGTCLMMPALTYIALALLRRWIADTRDERQRLAIAQRHAEGERTRFIALEAALENEHGRLIRDVAAERAQVQAQLAAEREAMRVEFDSHRAELVCETMEATVLMIRNNKFAPSATATARGKLIRLTDRLPAQGHAPVEAQERSQQRERGHAGS